VAALDLTALTGGCRVPISTLVGLFEDINDCFANLGGLTIADGNAGGCGTVGSPTSIIEQFAYDQLTNTLTLAFKADHTGLQIGNVVNGFPNANIANAGTVFNGNEVTTVITNPSNCRPLLVFGVQISIFTLRMDNGGINFNGSWQLNQTNQAGTLLETGVVSYRGIFAEEDRKIINFYTNTIPPLGSATVSTRGQVVTNIQGGVNSSLIAYTNSQSFWGWTI